MKDPRRTFISRGEHNEVSPPHRIAGGTKFDGEAESHGHPLRAAKAAGRNKKTPLGNALNDILDENGNILYND